MISPRFALYNQIITSTQEVLAEPSVQSSLGQKAVELTALLDATFPLERRLGRIVMPEPSPASGSIGV